jgi:hypothetical protein
MTLSESFFRGLKRIIINEEPAAGKINYVANAVGDKH